MRVKGQRASPSREREIYQPHPPGGERGGREHPCKTIKPVLQANRAVSAAGEAKPWPATGH